MQEGDHVAVLEIGYGSTFRILQEVVDDARVLRIPLNFDDREVGDGSHRDRLANAIVAGISGHVRAGLRCENPV